MPELPRAKIVERRDITDDLWIIKLKPEVEFSFKAGQYITIGAEGIERPYSIVSAPHEPQIELFVEIVPQPDGNLTPILHKMGVGDMVTMRPRPKGIFTMDEKFASQFMVSTVTGVAPYLSIIRSYLHRGASGHRFFVLEGASYIDEFTYDEELEDLASTYPDLIRYVPTVSRPDEKRNTVWSGETGRVNTIIQKYLAEFGLEKGSTLIYACGHPGMIEGVKSDFLTEGWNIKEERFWKDD